MILIFLRKGIWNAERCEKECRNAYNLPHFLENRINCSPASDSFLKTINIVVLYKTLTMLDCETGFSANCKLLTVIKGAIIKEMSFVVQIALKCSASLSPLVPCFNCSNTNQERQCRQPFPSLPQL